MATRELDHWADILVIVLYFALVLLVGMWSLCRPNRDTIRSYFLAGRSMAWWPVGASLFASNIGSEHFVGLAGTGAASGFAIVLYEWLAMPLLIVLAWLFVPVYVAAGVYTMPEYIEKRFHGFRIRLYLSILAIVLYIVTKLAVSIFAGALFIQLALGWDMYLSIAVLLLVTGIFTILGGLAAVIYTDTFQTGIMLIGALVLTGIGFNKIGGYDNLQVMYMNATPSVRDTNTTCGYPRDDAFHILRHPLTSDHPWPGTILHILFGCLWYFCCDQVIVQRSLAARSLLHAKAGSILAGYMKIFPMFIMIIPGMISRALYPDEIACVTEEECLKYCGNPVGCSNIAYPKLVLELLPAGLRGLLMAVMLSAIMSSLTSIFNSASTIFTMDIWKKIRSTATERELLTVGRLFVLVLCAVSILWIPLVRSSKSGQLFIYIQAVQGYLGVPLGPLFLMAILWKRMTEPAAFWSLVIGHTCGVIRMVLDFSLPAPDCGEHDSRPGVLSNVHYTYFGLISFSLTTLSILVISQFTQPEKELDGLMWWTRYNFRSTTERQSRDQVMSTLSPELETLEEDISLEPDLRGDNSNYPEVKCTRVFYKLCGIPVSTHVEPSRTIDSEYKMKFLTEDSRWKNILTFNAFVGVLVITFLIGYFG